MQDIQLTTDIIIGILGESISILLQETYVDADHSAARCIRGTSSDATKGCKKRPLGGDPSAHSGRAQAVRWLDHTRRRSALSLHSHIVQPRLTHSPESTTIALLARLSGLTEPLRAFVKTKSVWGTCAGAILLSQAVTNPKKGGQELLGGISVTTTRNGWGSQVRHHAAFCVASVGDNCIDFFMHAGRVF